MVSDQRFRLTQDGIGDLLPDIQKTIHSYMQRTESAHRQAVTQVRELMGKLVISFTPLGLSQELEEEISDMVQEKVEMILKLFDLTEETTATLGGLESRLRAILDR